MTSSRRSGSARKLAQALAERLRDALPAPLTIVTRGDGLVLYAESEVLGGSAAARIIEDDDSRPFPERVETAIRAALGGVQDGAVRYLGREWPVDAQGRMALPDARADPSQAYLWYGTTEGNAVVTLRPIELADLID